MSDLNKVLKNLSGEAEENFLEIARLAELGMNSSMVVHELRQPLTALSMALQITLEYASKCDNKEVESGLRDAIKLNEKVDLLLARSRYFMKPSSGIEELDVEELILKVLSVFEWQIKRKSNIRFKYEITDMSLKINGDESQLEQMLANLVNNAIDAVENRGDAVINIIARASDGKTQLIVTDTGKGIDETIADSLFEPFISTKGSHKGTGLGLYIVSKIAKRHNAFCRLLNREEIKGLDDPKVNTGFLIEFSE
ncbi:MAG: HAMP domain-containing histidine kinase [Deltaproteobacteria bacterium]|nr:HAMP domain-containing histidine kinase [Deltaproteobacteria bacterium]